MRLVLILTLTIYLLCPVALSQEAQRWLVFRRDAQGRINKESTEIWIGKRPTVGDQPGGKKGNLPAGCEVRLLQPDQDPREVEITANGLTAKKKPVEPKLSAEQIKEAAAAAKIEELLADDQISDAKWLKVFRLKYSRSARAAALTQLEDSQ